MKVSKIVRFDAAHKLYHPQWDAQKNQEVYGKCNNLHGHRYTLIVTVEGPVAEDGMVINFSLLKKIIKEENVDCYDHQYLNECSDFRDSITTSERLLQIIHQKLAGRLLESAPQVILSKLELYETDTSFCTWEG